MWNDPSLRIVGDPGNVSQVAHALRRCGFRRVEQFTYAQDKTQIVQSIDVVIYHAGSGSVEEINFAIQSAKKVEPGSVGAVLEKNQITFCRDGRVLTRPLPLHENTFDFRENNKFQTKGFQYKARSTAEKLQPQQQPQPHPRKYAQPAIVIPFDRNVNSFSAKPNSLATEESEVTTLNYYEKESRLLNDNVAEQKPAPTSEVIKGKVPSSELQDSKLSLRNLSNRLKELSQVASFEREIIRRNLSLRAWNQAPEYQLPNPPQDMTASFLVIGKHPIILPLCHGLKDRAHLVAVPDRNVAELFMERGDFDGIIILPDVSAHAARRFCAELHRNPEYRNLPFFFVGSGNIGTRINLSGADSVTAADESQVHSGEFIHILEDASGEYIYRQQLEDALDKTRVSGVQDAESGLFDTTFAERYADALDCAGVKASMLIFSIFPDTAIFPPSSSGYDDVSELVTISVLETMPKQAMSCQPSRNRFAVIFPECSAAFARQVWSDVISAVETIEIIDPETGDPSYPELRGEIYELGVSARASKLFERARAEDLIGSAAW